MPRDDLEERFERFVHGLLIDGASIEVTKTLVGRRGHAYANGSSEESTVRWTIRLLPPA